MNRKIFLSIIVLLALVAEMFGAAMPVFAAADDVTLTIPLINTIAKGATGTVPVQIVNKVNMRGYQLYINFDATRIQVNSVADGGYVAGCTPTNMPTIANGGIDNTNGVIKAANCNILGGADQTPGSGTLLNLNVTVKSSAANGRAMFSFPTSPLTQQPKIYDTNATAIAQSNITQNVNWLQVGPAASLQVSSITFSPVSGNPTTTATITVKNVGAGAMDSTESYVFHVVTAPSAGTTADFTVSGLGAAGSGTDTFTQTYSLALGTNLSTVLTVSNSTWAASGVSATYFAAISDIKNTNVNASFNAFINLTTDSLIDFGTLALGPNSHAGAMNVKSNAQQWQVTASSTNGGQMAEWNIATSAFGTTPNNHKLHDQIVVSQAKRASVSLTGATGTLIPDGVVANQSADAGEDYVLNYSQVLHAYDAAVAAGNSYHSIVTYTAAVTF